MMERTRIKIPLMLLLAIVSFGTAGYVVVEDMPPFDAFYMTLITISTVGFSEVKNLSMAGRTITIVIIVSGISVLTYTFGQILRIVVEGELRQFIGRRKVEKQISALKNHYIICGYGRIGDIISQELAADGIPLIVIERNEEIIRQLESKQILCVQQDATSESALIKAGVMDAKGVVTAVRSDADNVFITLTVKGLRPDIFILSRASEEKNKEKLLRAGATKVVCPYMIGGQKMAHILKKPTVTDFIDIATMNTQLDLSMEEVVVGECSEVAGKSLVDSQLRKNFGVIIVAIKTASGDMIFNPLPGETLKSGDVLVVIGKKSNLAKMNCVLA